jgi:hypothetical protein
MTGYRPLRRLALLLSLLAPILVLGAVWWPDVAHYYISTPTISDQAIEMARRAPEDSLLQELSRYQLGITPRNFAERDLVAVVDKLLRGQVEIAGLPHARVTLPFSADDLDKGPGSWDLAFAALALPDVLLRAYGQTHDDRYLFAARDMILGWAKYERGAWLPRGHLWNDHALAARVPVLADFWLAYRQHPAYDPAVARVLFEFLGRTAYVLADPSHFTFSTNHGVMQNLALCHLSLAFPGLPHAARYRDIAVARLRQQMAFYINTEGVVLEHSAGYHKFGLELLGTALRYLTLMHIAVPDDWLEKYRQASLVYAQLRRPDGSLPLIGDTGDGPDPRGPLISRIGAAGQAEALRYQPAWRPAAANSQYPLAGYSIWWDGLEYWPQSARLSQTVVAWSYFAGHGHKHADELSVSLWAAGQSWWSNAGYWTYDRQGRSQVASWGGSNAPHLVGEAADSRRSTRLVSSAWSPGLAALHLERSGPNQFRANRQVLHLGSNLWVIVDHSTGGGEVATRTQWTTSPSIRLVQGESPGSYALEPAYSRLVMSVRLLTSPGTTVRQMRGSLDPFAGWQIVHGASSPASALVIDQPARDSWIILVSCLDIRSSAAVACPDRVEGDFRRDDDWIVRLSTRSARLTLRRSDRTIQVNDDRAPEKPQMLALQAPDDVSPKLADLRRAHADASRYPRFRDLTRYRIRASLVILLLVATQETLFALPTVIKRHYALFRALATLAWALFGMWLVFRYFQ